jgi:hypothetical protein
MQEDELKAYQGLQKQGVFLLRSPRFGLVVVSTRLPNLTVTLPIRIPVTISEYLNRHRCVPTYYKGPDIQRKQIEYCVEHSIRADPTNNIIFNISIMYFSRWKPPGVSERMWSVNLDASNSGEYQTLGGHSCRPSE